MSPPNPSPLALITGGAGFIGSYVADDLLARGWRVRALDVLCEQVHGSGAAEDRRRPDYLDARVELIVGDVGDRVAVRQAVAGVSAVFHLAARVGVGQSMYEIAGYTETNNVGTAVLLETLAEQPAGSIRALIVASSMSVYGEGLYRDGLGRIVGRTSRSPADLASRRWDPLDGVSGLPLTPLPTPESKTPDLASVYALGKYDQERMGLIVGRAYGIPTVALRFFNVYGPRQALGNPYTGVLAIFANRLLNGRPPLLYEDGRQLRDFVHVRDVASACRLAMEAATSGRLADLTQEAVFNIGSGVPRTVASIANDLAGVIGRADLTPTVTGKYRVGDIRHCVADVSAAGRVLGYTPRVAWQEGLAELADWLASSGESTAHTDRVPEAGRELETRGLTR